MDGTLLDRERAAPAIPAQPRLTPRSRPTEPAITPCSLLHTGSATKHRLCWYFQKLVLPSTRIFFLILKNTVSHYFSSKYNSYK